MTVATVPFAETTTRVGSTVHQLTRRRLMGLWLLITALAVAVCGLTWPRAHLGDEYIPVSIDSFYHARRILDTAADPAAFYEFDPKIHAPEGSLVPWPWGYDYAMGWLVRIAGEVGVPGPPIAFLIWIPVAAVALSVALTLLIAVRLSLSPWSAALAGLCVAFSPLTQILHGFGVVDHHFAEYIFLLATIACGLKWFSRPDDRRAAVTLGVVLGAAPAVHNGLFILQIPVLATAFLWWLQNKRFPPRPMLLFCATLLSVTLAILIPSLPFRMELFEFYTLSWFHLYVAVGTVVVAIMLTVLPRSPRNATIAAVVGVALLAPLGHQILIAQSFLTGTIKRLDVIVEMKSLWWVLREYGARDLTLLYSSLIWLLPLTLLYCAFKGWRERANGRLFFWLCCVLGLTLLVMQLRMHYFGSFALVFPVLILVEDLAGHWPERRKMILLLASLGLVLAFWIPVRYQLIANEAPSGDVNFRGMRVILGALQKACAEEPGVVLADNDAGHYIRYYTECSVIANNFLLTKQHEQKVDQIDYLTSLRAGALMQAAPYVRYLLLRPVSVTGTVYMSYSQKTPTLLQDLLLQPVDQVPPGYQLIQHVDLRQSKDSVVPFIRLYKVSPAAGPEPAPVAESPRH